MSLARILRGSSRHAPMPYMDSDLDILNAVQYDIGVPLPAMTRATRGAKRKLLSMSTEPEDRRDYTESGNASRPRTNSTKPTGVAHDSAVTDLLSSVDVAPPSLALRKQQQEDHDMEGAPPAPTKRGRKAAAKRTGGKAAAAAAAAALAVDNGDSDEVDDDGEEGEAEKKRARGRPRIDVKDVTAADRRRTQIRLAQRAYRSRKEKAIVSLEKRVNSLKDANEAMSNAFMSLHDFAVGRGLLDQHPDLAQQLRQTTEVFLEMARQSSADEDMDDHDEEDANNNNNTSGDTNPHAEEAARAFEKKQQAITDAVKTFGYHTQQDMTNKNRINNQSTSTAPDVLSQQLMMPPQAAPIRQSNPMQNHLYGGIVMHQPLNMDGSSNGGPFDQQAANLFDSSFGMAMNIVNSVTNSPAGTVPVSSFYTGTASGNGASGTGTTGTGTGTGSNDMSSSNSVLSVSPASGRNIDFGLNNQFGFDGPSFSLFPNYQSPGASGQTAVPTSTSDLAPHLADTDAFIANAAMGSPYAGLEPPTNYPPDISFGLRLRRYAIESAYRLINSSDPPADAFARAFGFCIMFEPVDQIRQRLLRGLETPFTPSKFTRWELPFVSQNPDAADPPQAPGPAPSIASHSSSRSTVVSHNSSKSTTSSASSRGSNRIPNNSNSDHRGTSVRPVTPRIHVTLPGFEGAFYDCEETEMYLQQRGVHIPPNSDSVIVEVDDADFALDDSTTVVSSGTMNSSVSDNTANTANTSRSSDTAKTNNGMGMFDYLSPDLITSKTALNSDAMDWSGSGLGGGGSGVGAGGVAGTIAAAAAAAHAARGGNDNGAGALNKDPSFMSSFMDNPMFGFPSPPQPNTTFPQRRLLSLDVDKFLKELVRRGTCLGQTPGFRASDVNEAFWSAARNASSM